MSNQVTIGNLIRGLSQSNPQLYSALQQMLGDLYKVYAEVFPEGSGQASVAGGGITPDDVTNIIITTSPTNLRLDWDDADNAALYEIRKGSSWDTATFILKTQQSVANLDPVVLNLIYGDHTFLIKSINSQGTYSDNATSALLHVPTIGSPSLSGTAIGNNALLSWGAPTSTWLIAYYIIYRNSIEIGRINGNFKISSELVGGIYDYTVEAVDIVGNVSTESPSVELTLSDPVDLVFLDSVDASLTGTFSDTVRTTVNGLDGVLGPVNNTETYEDHFINNSFGSPQDQIDGGYPYVIEPTETTGYYEEVFDFGSVIDNVTINVIYSLLAIIGATGVSVDISYSTDDITYTSPVTATTLLATSMRYVKVRWTFTNGNDLDAAFIHGLTVSISTQLVLDSGSGTANSGDAGGTTINTNKTFTAINSVTLTANSTTPVVLVYDDVTTNSFDVYAFDLAGVRVTVDFAWKVRGIING